MQARLSSGGQIDQPCELRGGAILAQVLCYIPRVLLLILVMSGGGGGGGGGGGRMANCVCVCLNAGAIRPIMSICPGLQWSGQALVPSPSLGLAQTVHHPNTARSPPLPAAPR